MNRRLIYVYYGAMMISVRRAWRHALRNAGESLRRLARRLIILGEDSTPRWTIELFHQCYLADAEFHMGTKVFRGPMYAAYTTGDTLSFRMNWLAEWTSPLSGWDYSRGAGLLNLNLHGHGAPHELETGDVWFTFDGGYAVLYLGAPRQSLEFKGVKSTLRRFTYF